MIKNITDCSLYEILKEIIDTTHEITCSICKIKQRYKGLTTNAFIETINKDGYIVKDNSKKEKNEKLIIICPSCKEKLK